MLARGCDRCALCGGGACPRGRAGTRGEAGAGFEAGVEMACVELTVEGIWATTHTLLMPRSQVGDT